MGRKFVIGDIHGCLWEFMELCENWDLQHEDTVIIAGDILHKGPYSVRCLRYAWQLQRTCNVIFVAGNHEEKQLRWANAEARRVSHGIPNALQHTEGFAEIDTGLTLELKDFLLNSRLYYQAEGFLILHGGLSPTHNLPPDITLAELFSMKSSDRDFFKQILWTRYVNPQGYPVALGSEKPEDKNWTEQYDGRCGTILFGHQPYLQDKVRKFPYAIGLDLGCVFGNYLAAVQISQGQVVEEYYIKAHHQYAKAYYLEPN